MKKNRIVVFIMALVFFTSAKAEIKDSVDVYLSSSNDYCFNIVFDNQSNDSITLYSCFNVFGVENQPVSGFVVIMYVNGVEGGMPIDEAYLLRFSNCHRFIGPHCKDSVEISMKSYIPRTSDVNEVGIQLLLNYRFFKRNVIYKEQIMTNTVVVFRRKDSNTDIASPHLE